MSSNSEDNEKSVEELFHKWGLTQARISRLWHCNITTVLHLALIDVKTMERIFNEDSLIEDSLLFKLNLMKMRKQRKQMRMQMILICLFA
ncbi:hypothetical protein DMENIID0001_166640 [Sergentomyia squamirostris]